MGNSRFAQIRSHILPVFFLLVATFAVYARTMGHEFLSWDDDKYITFNEVVRGFTCGHLKAAFTNYYVGNYAPVHIVSYMLDYSIWGMRASGFLFTNILLHALNGVLFYVLIIKFTGQRLWAFLAAFIFLFHPVQVESVAWLSQRKNVLAMLFFLGSFYSYVLYRERRGENSKFLYVASITAYVMALLAKSITVILPPVLLLYDRCFTDRDKPHRWVVDKIPYIVAAAVVALVAMDSQSITESDLRGGRTAYHGGSPLATFFTMLPVFVRYLTMLFWPAKLSALYNPSIKTHFDTDVAVSAFVLVVLSILGIKLYRMRKDLFFGFALFFIGLIPVSQIVPLVTLMNDRYLYFPMLGAAFFFSGAILTIDARLGRSKIVLVAFCAVLLVLPYLSLKRAEVWRDNMTLWSDTVSKTPDSTVALINFGNMYREADKPDAALRAYLQASKIDATHPLVLENIGIVYTNKGEILRGRPYLQQLVRLYPTYEHGIASLAYNYYMAGELGEAEKLYRNILKMRPTSVRGLSGLGDVCQKAGKLDEAFDLYSKALAVEPLNRGVLKNIGLLSTQKGKIQKGRAYLLSLVQHYPEYDEGFLSLGNNYYMAGELEKAEEAYRKALQLNPRLTEALGYLGNIYLNSRNLPSARELYLKAIKLGGSNSEMEYNLACVEALANRPDVALGHLEAALRLGFRDINRIRTNSELRSLWSNPGFQRLMVVYRRKGET